MLFGKNRQDASPFAGQRKKKGRFNRRVLSVVGLASLAGLFLFGQLDDSDVMAWLSLRQDTRRLSEDVRNLEAGNAELEDRIEAIADDPLALEKLAREKHNMRRADEEVLTVIDQPEQESEEDK